MSANRSTPTSRESDQRLVCDIATSLINRNRLRAEQVNYAEGCEGLDGDVGQLCFKKAQSLDGQTLGRIIVAFPRADLYGQHGGTWLGKYESGPDLLQQIVATVLLWTIRGIFGFGDAYAIASIGRWEMASSAL